MKLPWAEFLIFPYFAICSVHNVPTCAYFGVSSLSPLEPSAIKQDPNTYALQHDSHSLHNREAIQKKAMVQ
jgi:hypothetical protein